MDDGHETVKCGIDGVAGWDKKEERVAHRDMKISMPCKV